jgi:hypothetical protein
MGNRRFALTLLLAAWFSVGIVAGQAPKAAPVPANTGPIRQADLKRWLTTLASDAMEGRVNGTDSLVRAGDYLYGLSSQPLGVKKRLGRLRQSHVGIAPSHTHSC